MKKGLCTTDYLLRENEFLTSDTDKPADKLKILNFVLWLVKNDFKTIMSFSVNKR